VSHARAQRYHASVPDTQSHRGAHPEDARDFAPAAEPRLRAAARELSFLLTHDYAAQAALKLVGDHHQLTARQRKAVQRASASDSAIAGRRARRIAGAQLTGQKLTLDGFNCLITVEAMLAGAPLLRCRDHVLRDLASVHGSYRSVHETERAVDLMLDTLARRALAEAHVLLDRPVGNSGRTRALFEQRAASRSLPVRVSLAERVDPELAGSADIVASSDSWILDRVARSLDLPALVAEDAGLSLWLVDFADVANGA
jgi:hypothetical protein